MATSGSKSVVVANATNGETAVTLQLNWSVNWQSTESNRSSVHFELRVITGRYGAMTGSATKEWDIWANGVRVNFGTWSVGMGANQNRLIGSGDIEIPHNADGTKTFDIAGTAQFRMNFNGYKGDYTIRYTGTLNTIPRASTPSVGSARTIGSAISISTNRASSSFTHTLTYKFGSASGTIATGVGASTNWTPPMSLCNQIPNATSGTLTITCVTYSGSTNIGTKTTSVSLSVPSSVVPRFTASSITDSKGYLSTYGAFVQGKSTAVANATAAGSYGSTIKSYSASLDGLSASASGSGAKSMTLGAPPTAGNRTVTLKATDSRNRSITGTKAITVAAYVKPSISNLSCDRYDTEAGKYDDEATTIRIVFNYTAHDVNSAGVNKATVKIEWKEVSSSSWTTAYNAQQSALSGSITYDLTGKSSAQSFDIRVTVTDSFGESYQLSRQVGTAEPVMDFKDGGRGIGIGRVATLDDTLDIGWETVHRKPFYVAASQAGWGSDGGYIRIASIVAKAAWNNSPISFMVSSRSRDVSTITVRFYSRNYVSPLEMAYAVSDGLMPFSYRISGATCDIFIHKSENNESLCVIATMGDVGYAIGHYNDISYPMDYYSALPSGAVNVGANTKCYPVGTVLIRYDHTSPASIYGGTWSRISGRFLYATGETGTIGATGGSGTHTLSVNEIPSHGHAQSHSFTVSGGGSGVSGIPGNQSGWGSYSPADWFRSGQNTGGGKAHNNNPAFINVSVWRRTA